VRNLLAHTRRDRQAQAEAEPDRLCEEARLSSELGVSSRFSAAAAAARPAGDEGDPGRAAPGFLGIRASERCLGG
jgi:hypothetical protein